jgi:arsenate reductase-like glutaredoxin family protein
VNIKKNIMTDKIVEDVIQLFQQRSATGIKKYGTTLEQNNTDDFIQHLQEELMDAVLYLQKIKSNNETKI